MTESMINLQFTTNEVTTLKEPLGPSEFYNLFIEHYNKSKNKITAVTEIRANRDEFLIQEKECMNQAGRILQDLKGIPKPPPKSSPKSNEYHYIIYSNLAMKWVVAEFDEIIKNEYYINYPDKTLEKLEKVINKSFYRGPYLYPASECMIEAKRICSLGNFIVEYREKREHLDNLLQEILMFDYPPVLRLWEELSDEEKQNLRGASLHKHKQKKINQAVHYPEIYKAALKVIGDKNLSDFLTPGGNANSNLYKKIHQRYKGVALGTLKDWLNDDLKSGKFVKGINCMREELKNEK